MTADHPPAFEPISAIELQSIKDSKIVAVSLYSSRAEVTRLYKFEVKTGQNQVNIAGLPNVLETESLRVEGRGAATIHDVTVSMAKGEHVATSSPKLVELLNKREKTASALARCEKALAALEQYLGSLAVQHLEVSKLDDMLGSYEATGARLDAKKAELTDALRAIDADVSAERAEIEVPHENDKLRIKAAIGVFAETAGSVEIALIYAVPYATWTAFYDIRVDMDTKDNAVTLIYKAAVQQNTGESWDDVPLQLETSTPTFGLGVPKLSPWNLSIQPTAYPTKAMRPQSMLMGRAAMPAPMARRRMSVFAASEAQEPEPEMAYLGAAVTSKGNVSATFRVPGLVTIPCDDEAHNFTIVELSLKTAMSWVTVPRLDAKTHLNARITNASEYTLLHGTASVYVDGSFISRSVVPAVSPQESFDCPLGLDPSIRITYHPVSKKLTQSGFYTKSANYVFAQRITVHNTKNVAVERLKVVDHIPASQNAQIEVKLVSPALTVPPDGGAGGSATTKGAAPRPQVVNVAKDVVAQWDGADEPDCEVEALGAERKVNWICAVQPQAKINLVLEWEVTVSPASAQVVGL
ncbi:hypothetical protein B0H15DRAFT_414267 [Mycena belliarum]|uniref:Mucoidy inhibitor A n=1 Tax=Mycena belliarum TaxID=1033014 RepID=A0AAD6XV49_9AGAR|nr:hypothetical protein B0H15DRAFT_414267 [Mycena belliae]